MHPPQAGLDLLRQRGVAELLAVSLHVHVLGVAGVLHVAAQYDGGVLRVELHHVADAAELLAGHERGAGASEGVHDHGVLLRGVLDRVAQKVEGFAGRVILVALRLVVVPDGGSACGRSTTGACRSAKPIEHRLVLPLVVRASEHEAVLHPDAHTGEVEARVDERLPEGEPFGVRMEAVGRSAFLEVVGHVLEGRQQELVELLALEESFWIVRPSDALKDTP